MSQFICSARLRPSGYAGSPPFAWLARRSLRSRRRLERVKGIEPSSSAWKAVALPLSYTRLSRLSFSSLSYGPSPPLKGLRRAGFATSSACQAQPAEQAKPGGGGWTRTNEADAADLQSAPFATRDTPPWIFPGLSIGWLSSAGRRKCFAHPYGSERLMASGMSRRGSGVMGSLEPSVNRRLPRKSPCFGPTKSPCREGTPEVSKSQA